MADHNSLDDDDKKLFREAVGPVKKLSQDAVLHKPRPPVKKRLKREDTSRQQATDPFSDDFQPVFTGDIVQYTAEGEPEYLRKQLRRGDFDPGMVLDLHGFTRLEARRELAAAISACLDESIDCLCIVHGVSGGVLKQNIPGWLMQHPQVRAFHQAPLEWGGQGALLVLLTIDEPGAL